MPVLCNAIIYDLLTAASASCTFLPNNLTNFPYVTAPITMAGTTANITKHNFQEIKNSMITPPIIWIA